MLQCCCKHVGLRWVICVGFLLRLLPWETGKSAPHCVGFLLWLLLWLLLLLLRFVKDSMCSYASLLWLLLCYNVYVAMLLCYNVTMTWLLLLLLRFLKESMRSYFLRFVAFGAPRQIQKSDLHKLCWSSCAQTVCKTQTHVHRHISGHSTNLLHRFSGFSRRTSLA